MLRSIRNLFRPEQSLQGLSFSRPLVLLHSDDWGRVGVRDREGYELLRKSGLRMGEHPYDLYSLETADDVDAVASLLRRHRDSAGRAPCMVMNVCTANLDFPEMRREGFRRTRLLPIANGLPGKWSRPGLFEAYRRGRDEGLFFPSLHGVTHFCPRAFSNALAANDERARLLRLLWEAETPYIYWRMPWVGYEYWNPEKPDAGFLSREEQSALIKQACENFSQLFGVRPTSACAPGCRANRDTHQAWSAQGVRVAENGSGAGLRPPHIDQFGILHVYRSVDFEPCLRELEMNKYIELASACFARGFPLIVSIHAINFHSTLKDFRSPSIAALDNLLTALEHKYPDLLYVNDDDLYGIVTEGAFQSGSAKVKITVRRHEWNQRLAQQGAV